MKGCFAWRLLAVSVMDMKVVSELLMSGDVVVACGRFVCLAGVVRESS